MSHFEIIGKLTKQENVNPIERNKLPNTFVINVPSPLAHYYNRFGHEDKPHTVLLITKSPISFEGILRATREINRRYGLNIDGAKSEIHLGRRKFNGIRIKGIKQYTEIPEIQKYFQEHGFQFSKNVRIGHNTDSLIRVNKFFKLQKVADGIYQSVNYPGRYYFEIPRDMTWDEFRNITFDIKHNIDVSGYDVAKAIFYKSDGIQDAIRIVKPEITVDMVQKVHRKYHEKLS